MANRAGPPREDRRRFLRRGPGRLAALATLPAALAQAGAAGRVAGEAPADARPFEVVPRVALGRTGLTASCLAQGTGFNGADHSSAHARLGLAGFERLIRHGLERGIDFIDAADVYGTHDLIRASLRGVPRDRYVLLTKLWPHDLAGGVPAGWARAEVERFRRELGVETIDVVLLHRMVDAAWPDTFERARDELAQLRAEGGIRALGVSCHDHAALRVAADHAWVDLVLARVNHRGGHPFHMDGTAEAIAGTLRQARRNGKAVVGMKVFGAGALTTPEEMDASLRHIVAHDLADAVTIGMLSVEQIDDTVARLARVRRLDRPRSVDKNTRH